MIDLGLARIGRLLHSTPQAWRAVHVAGTNGKGSICAYLSAMLHARGVRCARFTSPHLVDRWDCITVDERPVSEARFRAAEALVHQRDRDLGIGATEFELLTATAFEIFHQEEVEYGVVEVGLGGAQDATNALRQKSVTVISKIGLDHQGFLGSTLEEIARHKAGIMRRGVPCVVDSTNHPSVLGVIEAYAREVGADVVYPSPPEAGLLEALSGDDGHFEPHQIQNLSCARAAFGLTPPGSGVSWAQLLPVIRRVRWPGRLQLVDLGRVTGRRGQALLDGAHNPQSAEVLAAYVNKHLRAAGHPVTWVMAASEGKDMDGILDLLLRPGDRVAAVRFGPVDGMPWVTPAAPSSILQLAAQRGVPDACRHDGDRDLESTLRWASTVAVEGPMVIAGSLYLVSDTLRLLRTADGVGSSP